MGLLVQIDNDILSVEIDGHGAELRSVRDTHGDEWLWQGDPAYWAGRSPLLFPVIGRSPDNTIAIGGVSYPMASHGFARRLDFELDGAGDGWARFVLTDTDVTRESFPFAFKLSVTYELDGSSILCLVRVSNRNERRMPFQFGFHPGFVWPLPKSAGRRHVVTPENGAEPPLHRLDANLLLANQQYASPFKAGHLVPERSMFADDAMLFLSGAGDRISFAAEGGAKVEVKTVNLPQFALWQPPGAPFLCLEPWHGTEPFAGTGNSLETRHGVAVVGPGEHMEFRMDIRFTPA